MSEDCYIAILKLKEPLPKGVDQKYEQFSGYGSDSYREFKELAPKRGLEVVAEQFNVSEEEGKSMDLQLRNLVKRLNLGEALNPQEEFDKIRKI